MATKANQLLIGLISILMASGTLATEIIDTPSASKPSLITVYVAKKIVTMDPAIPTATAEIMRCIRLWTDAEGVSRFEEGRIALKDGSTVNLLSGKFPTKSISFAETQAGQSLDWHNAPAKQFVITLRGTLDFWNKLNEHFVITPGDILLAEDVTGTGHSWKLIGDDPWRRAYVILEADGDLAFIKN